MTITMAINHKCSNILCIFNVLCKTKEGVMLHHPRVLFCCYCYCHSKPAVSSLFLCCCGSLGQQSRHKFASKPHIHAWWRLAPHKVGTRLVKVFLILQGMRRHTNQDTGLLLAIVRNLGKEFRTRHVLCIAQVSRYRARRLDNVRRRRWWWCHGGG